MATFEVAVNAVASETHRAHKELKYEKIVQVPVQKLTSVFNWGKLTRK
jgi:hypothetical protein